MSLFGHRDDYDRKLFLRKARDLQNRGKHKKAIELFRRILIAEPNNAQIHSLIAPSLADRGLEFSAWASYTRTAKVLLRDGKKQQALDRYQDATRRMPRHYQAWTSRIALELSMGRKVDAKRSLKEALPHFRRRSTRYPLISLLRKCLDLDPGDPAVTLELASVLSRTGQKHEALTLLTMLAEDSKGASLRHVRRLQWNITPSLVHSWGWLWSCVASA